MPGKSGHFLPTFAAGSVSIPFPGTPMDGRAFLDIARELNRGGTEAHWRAAAGRAYYALFLEGRTTLERWGFVPGRRDPIHSFVRLRFDYAPDPDLKEVGKALN